MSWETTSKNLTAIQQYGLECGIGGEAHPYICENAETVFIGCCVSDPCSGNKGHCPDEDIREMIYHSLRKPFDLPETSCSDPDKAHFAVCDRTPNFVGCCLNSTCGQGEGCAGNQFAEAIIPQDQLERFFNFTPFFGSTQYSDVYPWSDEKVMNARTGLTRGDVAGLVIGFLLFNLVFGLLLWKYIVETRKKNQMVMASRQSWSQSVTSLNFTPSEYNAVPGEEDSLEESTEPSPSKAPPSNWPGGPQELHQRDYGWYVECLYDVLLTLTPVPFLVIGVVALEMDGTGRVDRAEPVGQLSRLVPTAYPVVFAAVASRFYKNIARWHLETPRGISLGALEQIFGSQSLAGAIEHLLFVRSRLILGIAILVLWTLSPLGGQAGSRILFPGTEEWKANGTVYYIHPGRQMSNFASFSTMTTILGGINSLYSSSLMASDEMKKDVVDIWGLPKIPQWTLGKETGKSIPLVLNSTTSYASLLGIRLEGLNAHIAGDLEYNFFIETSYVDLNCSVNGTKLPVKDLKKYGPTLNFVTNTFEVQLSNMKTEKNGDVDNSSYSRLDYASMDTSDAYFSFFNCDMDLVVLETEMKCNDTKCHACNQKRLAEGDYERLTLADLFQSSDPNTFTMIRQFLSMWVSAAGTSTFYPASPTDSYIAGELKPYGGHNPPDWSRVDDAHFSKRATTLFNTFLDASNDPRGHTDVLLTRQRKETGQSDPPNGAFFTSAPVQATSKNKTYNADRAWIAVLLTATLVLLLLALMGLTLRYLIRGPDILGFASSMTRENPYMPIPTGGTGLEGPERARALGDIRVQLADVRPDDDVGYVALRAVPIVGKFSGDSSQESLKNSWRPFARGRRYA